LKIENGRGGSGDGADLRSAERTLTEHETDPKLKLRFYSRLIIKVNRFHFDYGASEPKETGILWFWSKIRIASLGAPRGECIQVMISELATSDNV
jgi:hypothetical protein